MHVEERERLELECVAADLHAQLISRWRKSLSSNTACKVTRVIPRIWLYLRMWQTVASLGNWSSEEK